MIFLTIGTTEPFDRLVRAMDNVAKLLPNNTVIAQLSAASCVVENMSTLGYVSPKIYYEYFDKASVIVSHAGMGTIISALERKKRIIVMPRRIKFKEANSDHQVATAKRLRDLNLIEVVESEEELYELITTATQGPTENGTRQVGPYASAALLNSLRLLIDRT